MPPKPAKKGDAPGKKAGGVEDEARAKAEAVDDIDDEDYKKSLRIEVRALEDKIKKEEDLAGLYQDER
jgi:hypothetical protein